MNGDDVNSSMLDRAITRRRLLALLGGAGVTASLGLLAACNDGGADDVDPSQDSTSEETNSDAEENPASDDEPEETETPEATETDEPADEASDERPELVVAVQGLPATLDPYQHLSNVGTRVTYSIFDHLLERQFQDGDPPGTGHEIGPMLAESWERIDDLTTEFHLREDAVFHNGDPVTAEDVKFTFERSLNDPPDEILDAKGYVSTIEEIEVIDEHTVRFITAEPDPLLDMRVTSWATWILPKNYYEEVGFDGFALNPIGSGPYSVVELSPDDRLVLESFDDYFGGRPPASRVEFRVVPEVATRVSSLVSGEVDISTNIPPDQVATIEEADSVGVQGVPLANVHLIRYNTNQAALSDVRTRQAMNLAIDRELLAETLWDGQAIVPRGHQFPEYGEMYNPDRPRPAYDPDRARELLAESDYDGTTIIFRVSPFYYTNGLEAAQVIVDMWKEIGLDAEVEVRDNPYDEGPENIMVTNWSNSSFVADPDGALWLRWGADYPGTQKFFWKPEDPRFNELGAEARTTLDEEFRYDAYQEMLDIWEEEAPGTVLYIPVENYGVRNGIDWQPYSFYSMDFRADNLTFA